MTAREIADIRQQYEEHKDCGCGRFGSVLKNFEPMLSALEKLTAPMKLWTCQFPGCEHACHRVDNRLAEKEKP